MVRRGTGDDDAAHRIAWICGSILALGKFNHVIVVTLELILGYRFGARFPWIFILGNSGLAAAGNI